MLDRDLARLYGVETRVLNQAVQRNIERFPEDFMFQLSLREMREISDNMQDGDLTSQIVISNKRGGQRYMPYAFTETGIAMLSSVLRSQQAININIQIMRAFNAKKSSVVWTKAMLLRKKLYSLRASSLRHVCCLSKLSRLQPIASSSSMAILTQRRLICLTCVLRFLFC